MNQEKHHIVFSPYCIALRERQRVEQENTEEVSRKMPVRERNPRHRKALFRPTPPNDSPAKRLYRKNSEAFDTSPFLEDQGHSGSCVDPLVWDHKETTKGRARFESKCETCEGTYFEPKIYRGYPTGNAIWSAEYFESILKDELIHTLSFSHQEMAKPSKEAVSGPGHEGIALNEEATHSSSQHRHKKSKLGKRTSKASEALKGRITRSRSRRLSKRVKAELYKEESKDELADITRNANSRKAKRSRSGTESQNKQKSHSRTENRPKFDEFDALSEKMTFREFLQRKESRYIRWSLEPQGGIRGTNHSGLIPGKIFSSVPKPSFVQKGALVDMVLRLGTRKYTYPKHKDWAWNCLLQLVGSKSVLLKSPRLDPKPTKSKHKAPRCAEAKAKTEIGAPCTCTCDSSNKNQSGRVFEIILKPGEMLFIPPQWTHTVSSLDDGLSVAVNYFWLEYIGGEK